jgi:hypothetical protein
MTTPCAPGRGSGPVVSREDPPNSRTPDDVREGSVARRETISTRLAATLESRRVDGGRGALAALTLGPRTLSIATCPPSVRHSRPASGSCRSDGGGRLAGDPSCCKVDSCPATTMLPSVTVSTSSWHQSGNGRELLERRWQVGREPCVAQLVESFELPAVQHVSNECGDQHDRVHHCPITRRRPLARRPAAR